MGERGRFAGGDQQYLREVQYADPSRLTTRANLHIRYGTAPVAWFPWVVDQIDWPSLGDVLEVGCGPGWLWDEAASSLPTDLRLTLADLSTGMVAAAVERVKSLGRYGMANGQVADAQRLPFADASFDVVVANHMLYHVPDPALAVRELARVLRTGGVVVAATIGPRHLTELEELRTAVFGTPHVAEILSVFGSVSGRPILEVSFDEVEWRLYEDELHCTDAKDVVDFILSTPPGEDASPAQVEALGTAVQARFDASGGRFTVSKEVGVFLCYHPR